MITTLALTMLAFVTFVYIVSLIIKDASIMDVAWGLGFILVAAQSLYLSFQLNLPVTWMKLVLLGLICFWGLRLTFHIWTRHHGEDKRYTEWRVAWGSTFALRSYVQIFLLQGSLILLISMPVWLAMQSTFKTNMWVFLTGCFVWLAGFLFEMIADAQLATHLRTSRGKIMQTGLWRYSRHPNYFGEALLWWGVFLIGLSFSVTAYSLFAPVTITFLLLFVSGVPLLEKRFAGNPEWEHYKRHTSVFVPWFRK
ncbi:MAG TPA: DUF1295 domain-containing protein [Acidobacteriota bacterium]|nr:DUF1295 domain-containing protein [Acidobacteriota bacterium]